MKKSEYNARTKTILNALLTRDFDSILVEFATITDDAITNEVRAGIEDLSKLI